MSEKRDNSGSIGANKRKTSDRHPSHKGQCVVAGVEYWISGWLKDTDGSKWLSLSFERKDAQRDHAPSQPARRDPQRSEPARSAPAPRPARGSFDDPDTGEPPF